jgi:hypothetical protein
MKNTKLALLSLLVAFIIGCATAQGPVKRQTEQAIKDAYKVGLICSLTGPVAQTGSKQLEEIALFVDKINAEGGINGHQLYVLGPPQVKSLPAEYQQNKYGRLYTFNRNDQLTAANMGGKYSEYQDSLVCNDGGEKSKAIDCMNRLIERNVLAILGPTLNSTTMAIIPMAEKGKMPLISFGTAPDITTPTRMFVFKAKPVDAAATLTDALKRVGPDRERIRGYIEGRLGASPSKTDRQSFPIEIKIEQIRAGEPVKLYWSPNPIASSGAFRFEFVKCTEECTRDLKGERYAGMIAGPISPPTELRLPGPGYYAIKLSDFMSAKQMCDWFFFQVK